MSVDMKAVIARAHREVGEERVAEATKLLKGKLKQLASAETVVANIKREIEDLEHRIEQGNF